MPGLFASNSDLTFYKSDLYIVGWPPGLIIVDNELVSWAGCYRLWVRVVFLYEIWPFSICILSLSWFSIGGNSKAKILKPGNLRPQTIC